MELGPRNGCRMELKLILARSIFRLVAWAASAVLYSSVSSHAGDLKTPSDVIWNGGIVRNVHQYCNPIFENRKSIGSNWSTFKQLPSQTAVLGQYGLTSHIYSTARIDQKRQLLLISYANRTSKNCEAVVEFVATQERLKITTLDSRLRNTVLSTQDLANFMSKEVRECSRRNTPPPKYLMYGAVKIDSETGIKLPVPYSCETAVNNNSSAVRACVRRDCILVIVVGDTLFFMED